MAKQEATGCATCGHGFEAHETADDPDPDSVVCAVCPTKEIHRWSRAARDGSVLVMAYAIAHGRTYTSVDGETSTPQQAMTAAGLGGRVDDAERIARERFGWLDPSA